MVVSPPAEPDAARGLHVFKSKPASKKRGTIMVPLCLRINVREAGREGGVRKRENNHARGGPRICKWKARRDGVAWWMMTLS